MYKSNQPNKHKHIPEFKTTIRMVLFSIVLLLATVTVFSQEAEVKPRHFGIHGGITLGLLDSGFGPSASFHYAFRPQNTIQPEIALSFESQKGKTFLSGHNSSGSAFSLTPGIRINIRPQENWNPSILIMGGIMMGSKKSDRHDDRGKSGISGAFNLGVSNAFHKKHMITIGGITGGYVEAVYLKYGYWF